MTIETEVEAPPRKLGKLGKLGNIAVIIYATLGMMLLAMPEEISSRLDDFTPTPPVRAAQAAIGAIASVSQALGISPAFKALRAGVLDFAGIDRI